MAREDSVRCLRCLLYALNLLFWVSLCHRADRWARLAGRGFLPAATPECAWLSLNNVGAHPLFFREVDFDLKMSLIQLKFHFKKRNPPLDTQWQ